MLNNKYFKSLLIIFAGLLLNGCGPTSNKQKIIGTWETSLRKQNDDQLPTFSSMNRKIVLTFNSDLSLKSQIVKGAKVTSTYYATYDFENDQKHLVVYREGRKDRKNVAEIINLSGSVMTLVDKSGTGDTINLNKIK